MKNLEELRALVRAALTERGIDVDEIKRQREEYSAKHRRPFTTPLAEGVTSKFKYLPEGHEEFRPHPVWGVPVPRCQAKNRRTGQQCGAFARRGMRICRCHGGVKGRHTAQGKKNMSDSLIVHGRETRAKRKIRSEGSNRRRLLDTLAKETGLLTSKT